MKQPSNTFTIRIGNPNQPTPNPQEPNVQNKIHTNLEQTHKRHLDKVEEQSNSHKESDITNKLAISPQMSLLEQVRARNKHLLNDKHVLSEDDTNVNLKNGQTDKWMQEQDRYVNRSVSNNFTQPIPSQSSVSGTLRITSLLKKKGKTSGLAAILGIVIGVLLGIGAYFMFTGVAKPTTGNAVGLNQNGISQNGKSQGNTREGNNAQNHANTSSTISGNVGTGTLLGPAGATSGTTIYLYQIGIFSDSAALNKQIQTLKDNGILSFRRGSQPVQLVAGASPNKSGIDAMNKLLQDAAVEYYMKPFVVPNDPEQIGTLSNSATKDLLQALQDEWRIIDDFNQHSTIDSLSSVSQRVKDTLQYLPANYKQATQDIEASLNDLQHIHDGLSSSSSDTKDVVQKCYWLGKFYTEYAQGIADLQS